MKNIRSLLMALCLTFILFSCAYAESSAETVKPYDRTEPSIYAIDLESYYHGEDAATSVECQTPALFDSEIQRLPAVQARYDQGERLTASVLGVTEDVAVGVYALSAEDYQGAAAYLLLPGRELTDDELLGIIDAYAQLGMSFKPESLSWRNCMRGGAINQTRFLQEDERNRYASLYEQYKWLELRPVPSSSSTALNSFFEVSLQSKTYAGCQSFCFYPARRLTDEELLLLVQRDFEKQGHAVSDYRQGEQQVRFSLAQVMDAPLSLVRISESIREDATDGSLLYSIGLKTTDPSQKIQFFYATLDLQTKRLISADWDLEDEDRTPNELHLDPMDSRWTEQAKRYVESVCKNGSSVRDVRGQGETTFWWEGYGACVLVNMTDGSSYEVRIAYEDGVIEDVSYTPEA